MTPEQAWEKYVGKTTDGHPWPVDLFMGAAVEFAPPQDVTPEWAADWHLANLADAPADPGVRAEAVRLLAAYIRQHLERAGQP